jgi:hypothetical protein
MCAEWQTTDDWNKRWSECPREEGRGGDQELEGWKESRMQWEREEWKEDSGWIQDGYWEPEDVSDVRNRYTLVLESQRHQLLFLAF